MSKVDDSDSSASHLWIPKDSSDTQFWEDFFRAASRSFSYTVYFIAFSALVFTLWVQDDLTFGALSLRIGGLLFSTVSVGQLLVHIPRTVKRMPSLSDNVIERLAEQLKTWVPKVVIFGPSDRTQLLLRGRGRWNNEVTMLVSPRTWALWAKSSETKVGQIAHEMAHLASADTRTYSRAGAALLITATYLTIALPIGGFVSRSLRWIDAVLYILVVLIGLLAWRNYSRMREYNADLVAASAVGREQYLRLFDSAESESNTHRWSIPFLRSHPSVASRRSTIINPVRVAKSITRSLIFLGFSSYVFSLAIFLCLEKFRGSSGWNELLALVVCGFLLRKVFAGLFRSSCDSPNIWPVGRWARALLLASSFFMLIALPTWNLLTFCLVVATLLSVLILSGITSISYWFGLAPELMALSWIALMYLLHSGALLQLCATVLTLGRLPL